MKFILLCQMANSRLFGFLVHHVFSGVNWNGGVDESGCVCTCVCVCGGSEDTPWLDQCRCSILFHSVHHRFLHLLVYHLSAAFCWLAAINSEVNGEKDDLRAWVAVSARVALSVLGSSSVEAQSGSLRPLRCTNWLSDAPAIRAQARPRGPTHTLQHTVPHVWLRERSSALAHHAWERHRERDNLR